MVVGVGEPGFDLAGGEVALAGDAGEEVAAGELNWLGGEFFGGVGVGWGVGADSGPPAEASSPGAWGWAAGFSWFWKALFRSSATATKKTTMARNRPMIFPWLI